VLLFRRLGLGATLGYIVAGALVGPHVLGLVGDAEEMIGFAELGIVLLLFIVGLELKPERLWRMKREILGLGLLQVVLCGLAITGAGAGGDGDLGRRGPGAGAAAGAVVDRRRSCRCCSRPAACAPRSANGRSRSCCSRTCRSSRC
jgi:hypothetical protein